MKNDLNCTIYITMMFLEHIIQRRRYEE